MPTVALTMGISSTVVNTDQKNYLKAIYSCLPIFIILLVAYFLYHQEINNYINVINETIAIKVFSIIFFSYLNACLIGVINSQKKFYAFGIFNQIGLFSKVLILFIIYNTVEKINIEDLIDLLLISTLIPFMGIVYYFFLNKQKFIFKIKDLNFEIAFVKKTFFFLINILLLNIFLSYDIILLQNKFNNSIGSDLIIILTILKISYYLIGMFVAVIVPEFSKNNEHKIMNLINIFIISVIIQLVAFFIFYFFSNFILIYVFKFNNIEFFIEAIYNYGGVLIMLNFITLFNSYFISKNLNKNLIVQLIIAVSFIFFCNYYIDSIDKFFLSYNVFGIIICIVIIFSFIKLNTNK